MRILLINDYATPTGGAELGTLALRDGLRARGHDARVFASSAGGPGFADYVCFGTTSRFRTLVQSFNLAAARQLRRVLKEFRPDVAHVRMFFTQLSPAILPVLRDVPCVAHLVWLRPICPVGTKVLPDGSPCRSPWGAACYRHGCLPVRDWAPLMIQMKLWLHWRPVFKRVIANSHALRQSLLDAGIAPVEVIWNGVPVVPARSPLCDPPTVAFAGRLVRQKGCDVLVRALGGARLIIAGDGPERGALEQLSRAERVTFTGHLPRAELEKALAPAWVQVVPSRSAEGFGYVAAEAMMRGTAVVASRVGGLPEIMRDGETGVLVPPDDTPALAAALRRLLGDRPLAERLGAAGRAVARREFNEIKWIERFIELYEELRA